jgi:hypothetical protein
MMRLSAPAWTPAPVQTRTNVGRLVRETIYRLGGADQLIDLRDRGTAVAGNRQSPYRMPYPPTLPGRVDWYYDRRAPQLLTATRHP